MKMTKNQNNEYNLHQAGSLSKRYLASNKIFWKKKESEIWKWQKQNNEHNLHQAGS